MSSRPCFRAAQRAVASTGAHLSRRTLATARPLLAANSSNSQSTEPRTTHFGFQTVLEEDKEKKVAGVFTSVAESYDRMNDLMSFGWHRVWKYVVLAQQSDRPMFYTHQSPY